ncbi:unnamed protein product [Paramecium octaurelia]|uniref:Uncharacterized protein n=1 Tax=Paramecium octaurelia TaxID=43137 RepID=A0A8S1X1K4_PAROT|nr:unnamed protein product [Paramecium octaurelia]
MKQEVNPIAYPKIDEKNIKLFSPDSFSNFRIISPIPKIEHCQQGELQFFINDGLKSFIGNSIVVVMFYITDQPKMVGLTNIQNMSQSKAKSIKIVPVFKESNSKIQFIMNFTRKLKNIIETAKMLFRIQVFV